MVLASVARADEIKPFRAQKRRIYYPHPLRYNPGQEPVSVIRVPKRGKGKAMQSELGHLGLRFLMSADYIGNNLGHIRFITV